MPKKYFRISKSFMWNVELKDALNLFMAEIELPVISKSSM